MNRRFHEAFPAATRFWKMRAAAVAAVAAVSLLGEPAVAGPLEAAHDGDHFIGWMLASLGLASATSLMVFLLASRSHESELEAMQRRLAGEIEESRRHEERVRLLIDNASDFTATLDPDGCFTFVNSRCSDTLGCSPDACLHRLFIALVHSDDTVRARAAFDAAVTGRQRVREELRMLNTGGAAVPMQIDFVPHVREGGNVCAVLVLGRDVSARRKAEQKQSSLETQLRRSQKMEALGRLAGGIAHDFNNFLTVISTNCQIAQTHLTNEHPVMASLEEIHHTAHHAAQMVRQILAFSRNQKQDRHTLELEPVVQEAVRLLRAMLPTRIAIVSDLAPRCPPILGNAEQIHQVLLNLGTNATHAMRDKGGKLEISLTLLQVDEAFAARNADLKPGPYLHLAVSDNGHGMDAATLDRIFDPFFTTKPPGEGTGLGLSIVHSILLNHDGAIGVYSEPGRGTVFHLYFPVAPGRAPNVSSPATPPARGRGQHVLFVDDEPSLTEIGRRFLENLGYHATCCHSGAEAVQLLKGAQHFDCVFSDLAMADMNGLELANECRKIHPGTPFILASGYHSGLTIESLHEYGVTDFILKPFTLAIIAETLERVLNAETST
jgi:PAS domain S-box-containing protein